MDYDFCLDDDVTMAKLLKSLGVSITLDILEQLPHGFLSLSMVSQEAHVGCKKAISHIKHLLGIEEDSGSCAATTASATSTNSTSSKIT